MGRTTNWYIDGSFFNKEHGYLSVCIALSIIYSIVLFIPIYALIKYASLENIIRIFQDRNSISAIALSLKTSSVSVILTFLFGTPVAFILKNNKNNKIVKLFRDIVYLPIVFPPSIAGIGLLLTFGRNGVLGATLSQFQINIAFTSIAVIIAQFYVSSPFYIQVLVTALDNVPKDLYEASYVLGVGKLETLMKVILPMLIKVVFAGLIMSWIRALGEFGATMMFAGNILDQTRTIPLQVYTLMQADIKMAAAVSVILFLISFIMLGIVKSWLNKED